MVTNDRVVVKIDFKLPRKLAMQSLHVTIKSAAGKRIDRKVVSIEGTGTIEVEFENDVPTTFRVSAFVGPAYESNLQHITTKPFARSEPR